VKTFSIGFEEEDFNELPYARLVKEKYSTDHHELIVRSQFIDILPKLVRHYGEPYADSSALPSYTRTYVLAGRVALNWGLCRAYDYEARQALIEGRLGVNWHFGRNRVGQHTVPTPPDSFSIAYDVCQDPV
jgi:hypothetical protein